MTKTPQPDHPQKGQIARPHWRRRCGRQWLPGDAATKHGGCHGAFTPVCHFWEADDRNQLSSGRKQSSNSGKETQVYT